MPTNERRIVALLGRRDEPTDALEEYCQYLGEALRPHGIQLELARVPWKEQGWAAALRHLKTQARDWRGQWIFLQYTALSWSSRGFATKLLSVLETLRRAGARVGIVYHDVEPYHGNRIVDRVRRFAQVRAMRRALRHPDLAVFTVSLDTISWWHAPPTQAVFIPVGANLPLQARQAERPTLSKPSTLRIVAFGFSGGEAGNWESARIAEAVRFAAATMPNLRLHALGRNADQYESALRQGLRDAPVEVSVDGILPADRVSEELSSADVMLFVRGAISTRRGSAIAGIACGLPIVAYRGKDTAPPITEAGVVLTSWENPGELGAALLDVLKNDQRRHQLAKASELAYRKYFSWTAIADRYVEELQKHSVPSARS